LIERLVVIGSIGSDAGYWVLGPDGWHHVGGWQPEALREVARAIEIIAETPALKTPGLANQATKGLFEFVQKELGAHLGEGTGTVVVVQQQR
jgi:hypothetical protein